MQNQCNNKIKQDTMIHDMMNAILGGKTKRAISSIYRKTANRFSIQAKSSAAMDMFIHVSLFVSKRLCKITDNTLKQERILYKKWQDQNWLFLWCYWDLICLPLTDVNGWEEATQKNTYGRIKQWTSANKRWTHTELWQLIKAHAPHIGVINYAEGSIVHFCLLLQIIERFKDLVGDGSCRLSFPSASSKTLSPLVSWLCLHFGAYLVISPTVLLFAQFLK